MVVLFRNFLVIMTFTFLSISVTIQKSEAVISSNSQFMLEGSLIPAAGVSSNSLYVTEGDTSPFGSPNVTVIIPPVANSSSGGGGGSSYKNSNQNVVTLKNEIMPKISGGVNDMQVTSDIVSLCSIPFRSSKIGNRGQYVVFVQTFLKDKKFYKNNIDGSFQKETKNAVWKFQEFYQKKYSVLIKNDKQKFTIDGIWGKQTHALAQILYCQPAKTKLKKNT